MKYYLGAIFFLFCILPTTLLQAATLYIDPGMATLGRGDTITTSIRVMPDQELGECINAADIVLTYPESILPVDVSLGRSIFSVWVEDPIINKESKTITFAGGIPNGYCGRVQGDPGLTNVIAEVVFRSPGFQIGGGDFGNEATISFGPETQLYLNDGQGTKANLITYSSTLTLEATAGAGGIVDDWRTAVRADSVPPEKFSILLERDPVAFNGKYFIIFSTSDKQTGLSHFEVMEEPLSESRQFTWGRVDAPWTRAVSPYVLKDQSLNSTIRVRAYDKAGNEYVATLIPNESMRSISDAKYMFYSVIGVAAVVVFSLLLVVFFLFRRRQRRKILASLNINSDTEDIV